MPPHQFIKSWQIAIIFICIDAILTYLVIGHVKYTEIDWSTYMAQVDQIFNSSHYNFNYSQIEGPTGPLVYPAGHVYVFSFLKELTDGGKDVRTAQYIYLLIYLAQMSLVYKIYTNKRVVKVPPYVFGIMCFTSYRIHSIYVLRLFNDPIAILAAYASFYALLKKNYTLSSILFSFACSIKMNILLFAPAFALVFYEHLGIFRSIKKAGLAILVQLILALPFLIKDPVAYFNRSFDFGRVFLHKWTVNWRFLDESDFTSGYFFKILLIGHVSVLFMLFCKRWINAITLNKLRLSTRKDDPILTLFIANFVGVAFSRSLHYQFYVWYYHSLPMILWATRYNVIAKFIILACIEYAWNTYPSSNFSSLLLHIIHLTIIIGLAMNRAQDSDLAQPRGRVPRPKPHSKIISSRNKS